MRDWNVPRKLYTGLAGLLIVYGLSMAALLGAAATIERRFEDSREIGVRRLTALTDLGRSFELMYSGEKSQILAAWSNNQQNFQRWVGKVSEASAETSSTIDTLARLSRSESEAQGAARLRGFLNDWLRLHAAVIQSTEAGDFLSAQTLSTQKGIPIKEGSRVVLASLVGAEEAALDGHVRGARDKYVRSRALAIIGITLGLAIAAGWAWVIRQMCRSLGDRATEVQQRASHVLLAASEVAGSAQLLSEGASRQASAIRRSFSQKRSIVSASQAAKA